MSAFSFVDARSRDEWPPIGDSQLAVWVVDRAGPDAEECLRRILGPPGLSNAFAFGRRFAMLSVGRAEFTLETLDTADELVAVIVALCVRGARRPEPLEVRVCLGPVTYARVVAAAETELARLARRSGPA